MTADEQREVGFRLDLLKVAGEHCGSTVIPTADEIVTRARTYLTFTEEARQNAKGKPNE